jgi:hypothetical protein
VDGVPLCARHKSGARSRRKFRTTSALTGNRSAAGRNRSSETRPNQHGAQGRGRLPLRACWGLLPRSCSVNAAARGGCRSRRPSGCLPSTSSHTLASRRWSGVDPFATSVPCRRAAVARHRASRSGAGTTDPGEAATRSAGMRQRPNQHLRIGSPRRVGQLKPVELQLLTWLVLERNGSLHEWDSIRTGAAAPICAVHARMSDRNDRTLDRQARHIGPSRPRACHLRSGRLGKP